MELLIVAICLFEPFVYVDSKSLTSTMEITLSGDRAGWQLGWQSLDINRSSVIRWVHDQRLEIIR